MRITDVQLVILEMLTWHVRAATDRQVQQVLNDQSITGNASGILRQLANNGFIHRRRIKVAVPVLSKPLYSWVPGQSEPNFANLAWQLFVRNENNGQRSTGTDCDQNHAEPRPDSVFDQQSSLNRVNPQPSNSSVDRILSRESSHFSNSQTAVTNSTPAESENYNSRQPQIVNWATAKAAHLMAGQSGWGTQPLQLSHDLGTTSMFVSSRPYQAHITCYGEDIFRKRFPDVKKIPDAALVDREERILKVLEFGGQYSRRRLEDFHHYWRHCAWELW